MKRRFLRAAAAAAVLTGALATTVAVAHGGSAPVRVVVDGAAVRLSQRHATVMDALRTARITPRDGALFSVASHRVLDLHADPARVYLDDTPVAFTHAVRSGDHVRTVDGSDAVEAVVTRTLASPGVGLPPVESHLWRLGVPALDAVTVGVRSGEIVSRRVLSAGTPATPEKAKVVALTFDDGPDPRWTPMILQILHDEQVPATFCVVGHVASRHPELVVAEHDGGYALCDHTVHHIIHLDLRPHSQIVDEIDQAADFIRSVAGTDATYFRAPGGYVSDDVIAVAHQRGLRVLGWTVDPHDYQRPSVDLLLRRVLNTVRPGAIVLLHDGGGDRSHTVAALKPLIEFLKAAGYSFTTP